MARTFRIHRITAALALAWVAILSIRAFAQTKASAVGKTGKDQLPTGGSGVISRGLIVYRDRCAICHFNESDVKKVGPGLKGIYKSGKFADGAKVDDASMTGRIMNGGKDMPPFKSILNPIQLRDLIAYLKTL